MLVSEVRALYPTETRCVSRWRRQQHRSTIRKYAQARQRERARHALPQVLKDGLLNQQFTSIGYCIHPINPFHPSQYIFALHIVTISQYVWVLSLRCHHLHPLLGAIETLHLPLPQLPKSQWLGFHDQLLVPQRRKSPLLEIFIPSHPYLSYPSPPRHKPSRPVQTS